MHTLTTIRICMPQPLRPLDAGAVKILAMMHSLFPSSSWTPWDSPLPRHPQIFCSRQTSTRGRGETAYVESCCNSNRFFLPDSQPFFWYVGAYETATSPICNNPFEFSHAWEGPLRVQSTATCSSFHVLSLPPGLALGRLEPDHARPVLE